MCRGTPLASSGAEPRPFAVWHRPRHRHLRGQRMALPIARLPRTAPLQCEAVFSLPPGPPGPIVDAACAGTSPV
jgi:hypothetical protein